MADATTTQLNPVLARASEMIISGRYEEFETVCLGWSVPEELLEQETRTAASPAPISSQFRQIDRCNEKALTL